MNFDLRYVPFSIYGSRLVFSYFEGEEKLEEGLYLRNVQGGDNYISRLFRLQVLKEGTPVPFTIHAEPALLTLKSETGEVKLCISEEKLVRIKGNGVGLRFSMKTGPYDNAIQCDSDRWEVTSYREEIRFMLSKIKGKLSVDAPWSKQHSLYVNADFYEDDNGCFEGAIEEFDSVWQLRDYYGSFEESCKNVKDNYNNWLRNSLSSKDEYSEGRELASYITWSCVVAPKGKLTRNSMYMSKNWMTNIWSWDHCFNAMALAKNNPELALEQFMVFVDNQHPAGAFPDFINDRYVSWSCSKPPIHGWALNWMLQRYNHYSTDQLDKLYGSLCRWTEWWFKYRDYDNDGIPQYNHGNDSGWDNSTVFNTNVPTIESPDLTTFLILQMDFLAKLADKLSREEDKISWETRSKDTFERFIAHSMKNDKFYAPVSGSHEIHEADSLVIYMPLLLGKKLPSKVLNNLLQGLKSEGKFITEHGLATEAIDSPYYIPDGYWRGPIWAPSTMLIVDALKDLGEIELSKEIANKYCRMAQKSGMAENFNAITGEALRDRAFTWTSSVFLVLANEYC